MTEIKLPTPADLAALRKGHVRLTIHSLPWAVCARCNQRWPCTTNHLLTALDVARAALAALGAVLDFGTPVATDVRLGVPAIVFDGAEDVNAAFAQAKVALELEGGAAVAADGAGGEE